MSTSLYKRFLNATRLGVLLSTAPFLLLSSAAQTGAAGSAAFATMLREHRYAEVVAQANATLRTSPRDASLLFFRGLAADGLGRHGDALKDLRRALQLRPTYLQAAEAGAQIAYRDNAEQATSFLEDVLRLDPANGTAHAMAAVLSLEKWDCAAAIQHFGQAGELAAADTGMTRRIGLCRAQLSASSGDLPAAEQVLAALYASDPHDMAIAVDLAAVQSQEKAFANVITTLAPLKDSLSAEGLNMLASAQATQGDVAAAVGSYQAGIRRAPGDENGYIDLAILSMEHQSPEVAMTVLDAGLKANPHSARLLVARGTIYAQIGKDELAQSDFEAADRLAPSSTYGALGMGVLLREDGNLDQAEAVLTRKLAASPDNALLEYMLADVLVRKGATPGDAAFTRALQLLHTALAAQPSLAQAHALLGKLLLKDGHPEQATTELEAAIALQPHDRTALNQLVAAYRRTGRTADAERISATLEAGVAAERAQENDRNRIHLSIADPATAATTEAEHPAVTQQP